MCVIIFCDEDRPTEDQVARAYAHNDHGGGAGWRDGKAVLWEKGLSGPKGLERMQELAATIPLPYVLHFRLVSSGEKIPQLCHPFPVSKKVPLLLTGRFTGKILFHNGTWGKWRDVALETAVKYGVPLPTGKWSDTRCMAWCASIYGDGILEFIGEKVCLYGPDTGSEEDVKFLGEWVTSGDKGHKLWVTNKFWENHSLSRRSTTYLTSSSTDEGDEWWNNEGGVSHMNGRHHVQSSGRDDHGWGLFHENSDSSSLCTFRGCNAKVEEAGSGRCPTHFVCLFEDCKSKELVKGTRFCAEHQYRMPKADLEKKLAAELAARAAKAAALGSDPRTSLIGPMSQSRPVQEICRAAGCNKSARSFSRYCMDHARQDITCSLPNCQATRIQGTEYCRYHQALAVCGHEKCTHRPLPESRFCYIHDPRSQAACSGEGKVRVDIKSTPFRTDTGDVGEAGDQPQPVQESVPPPQQDGSPKGGAGQTREKTEAQMAAARGGVIEALESEPVEGEDLLSTLPRFTRRMRPHRPIVDVNPVDVMI